jgi:hypothetical protein
MRIPRTLLATVLGVGLVSLVTSGVLPAKDDPCEELKLAVERAKADYEVAKRVRKEAWDAIDVIEERIGVLEGLRNTAANAEAQAKNRWLGACSRYNACVSRPRNDGCASEKEAMDRATSELNACLQERLKWEGELTSAREDLKKARENLDKACAAYFAALNAVFEAEKALAGCQRFA